MPQSRFPLLLRSRTTYKETKVNTKLRYIDNYHVQLIMLGIKKNNNNQDSVLVSQIFLLVGEVFDFWGVSSSASGCCIPQINVQLLVGILMEEEDLVKAWRKLSLSCEEENTIVRVANNYVKGFTKDFHSLCLLCKLLGNRSISKEAIRKAFSPLWIKRSRVFGRYFHLV